MQNTSGFGAFTKQHREFFNALDDKGWEPVAGYTGVEQKTLSGEFDHDHRTGCVTRLSRWAPGASVADPVSHDWCEEVFLISGSMAIGTPDAPGDPLPAGTYAVRPPHIPHGPFFSTEGSGGTPRPLVRYVLKREPRWRWIWSRIHASASP